MTPRFSTIVMSWLLLFQHSFGCLSIWFQKPCSTIERHFYNLLLRLFPTSQWHFLHWSAIVFERQLSLYDSCTLNRLGEFFLCERWEVLQSGCWLVLLLILLRLLLYLSIEKLKNGVGGLFAARLFCDLQRFMPRKGQKWIYPWKIVANKVDSGVQRILLASYGNRSASERF